MEHTGDEFNAAVAAELRAQRGRKKMTVDALVRETGLSKSAVLNYLNDRRDIPVPALYAICHALAIAPAEVVELAEHAVSIAPVVPLRAAPIDELETVEHDTDVDATGKAAFTEDED